MKKKLLLTQTIVSTVVVDAENDDMALDLATEILVDEQIRKDGVITEATVKILEDNVCFN